MRNMALECIVELQVYRLTLYLVLITVNGKSQHANVLFTEILKKKNNLLYISMLAC